MGKQIAKNLTMQCLTVLALVISVGDLLDAQVVYNRTSNATLAWDPVTADSSGQPVEVDHYEVRLIRDGTFEEYRYGTSKTSLSIPRPRSGVYEIRVRAVRRAIDGTMVPGEWCSSLNASCSKLAVDNKAKPPVLAEGPGEWKVYFKVAAPVGPFIIIPR